MQSAQSTSSSPSLTGQVVSTNAQIGSAVGARLRGYLVTVAQAIWLAVIALALSLFVMTMPARALQVRDIVLLNLDTLNRLGFSEDFLPQYINALDILTLLVYTLIAVIVFLRKPTEWVALFASLMLVTTGATIVRPNDSLFFVNPSLRLPLLFLFVLGMTALVVFLYIFPDGRFVPKSTRALAVVSILMANAHYFTPATSDALVRWPPLPITPITLLGIALGGAAQIYRYARISSPAQKQQTKWVLYGVLVGIIGLVGFSLIVPALVPSIGKPGLTWTLYILLGVPLFYLCMMMLPLSLGFSILRFRLWQIDLVINRTIVYTLVTAILAGLFAALITITQKLFLTFTGAQSEVATILSTLVVVALFTPVKDLLQGIVDKRLKQANDPARELRPFSERVRARVTPVHAQQITQRLLDEIVAAFGAKGALAYLEHEGPLRLIFTSGDWDNQAELTVSYGTAALHLGEVSLSARRDGIEFSKHDRDTLNQVVTLVAQAIEEDRREL